MLPIHIALVTDKSQVVLNELAAVAAALQKQVLRDFAPIWGIQADVSAFGSLEDVPLDYWPVIIMDDIGNDSAAGYHQDDNGQPYSLVQYSSDWTLTASHEVLEMLGDPFGRRMIAGQSPIKGQGRVQFLVEVCDPSEAYEFAYRVNGIVVSDFYTPNYFDAAGSGGARYSFTNSIKTPRDVLRGGYLSWYAPATREWWQRTWFTGPKAKDKNLGRLNVKNGNPRNVIDRLTAAARLKAMSAGPGSAAALTAALGGGQASAFTNRADDLRKCVKQVMSAYGTKSKGKRGKG